ncbi:MAG: hypothetical protein U9R14_01895 [Patescibacteria group bacterium]|nr:hypothetical protein [Patescibacteria group bacterium]
MKKFIFLTIIHIIILCYIISIGKIALAGDCLGSMDCKWSDNISKSIINDTIWGLANSPYVISNIVQVYPEAKLTIESGVIVKFNVGASMRVDGELILEGNMDNKVIFTINDLMVKNGC